MDELTLLLTSFRKADLSDIDALARLRVDMLCEETAHPKPLKTRIFNNTKRFMSEGFQNGSCVVWVAERNDEIIAMGCVNFFVWPPNDWCPDGNTAYIGNMFTTLPFRKQGIASYILDKLINEAKSRSCERILLNATDMGRPLYEQHGFGSSPTAMAFFPFGIIPIF